MLHSLHKKAIRGEFMKWKVTKLFIFASILTSIAVFIAGIALGATASSFLVFLMWALYSLIGLLSSAVFAVLLVAVCQFIDLLRAITIKMHDGVDPTKAKPPTVAKDSAIKQKTTSNLNKEFEEFND
jgi:Flp pilus assembly protein TadB